MNISLEQRIIYTLEEVINENNSLDLGKIQSVCKCSEEKLKEIIATEFLPKFQVQF